MKGVGRVAGWRVRRRDANDIEWGQTRGNKTVMMWKVGLGGGRVGYEMSIGGTGKARLFKGAGSSNRALAAVKRYMRAH